VVGLLAGALRDFDVNDDRESPMENLTPTQKAYGLLWQEISDRPRVHQARRILLASMTKDEQRAAITWVKQQSPLTPLEILEKSP
jgi:hypothetical protein